MEGLVNAVVADAEEKLDAAQAAGRITEAQKQERLQELRERVTAMVNGERPAGAPRLFGPAPGTGGDGPWS